ncbi:MAG: SpoIIE family protein phosphatase [Anaerolineaceae bacterium]|nr:SpoIIE family protein phosphatase [Anaerolineaceae bacterium]
MQPLIVPGRLDSLERIGGYIMAAAKSAGLERARTFRLRLAVDEIATNIINYGYQRAGLEGVILVEADLDEHALTITLDDTAGYFDPTLRPPPPAEYFTKPLEEREIGGLGVYLAIQSVDQFHYQRLQDHNHNVFIMYRAPHGDLLVIDSSQDPCSSISQHLIGLGYTVTCTENGQKALDLLHQGKFEMVLIDLPMLDQSAEEFIKGMKADNALRSIPLIILVDPDQLPEAERCIKLGAEDYIVLPFIPVVLKSRIGSSLERQRVRMAEQDLKDTLKFGREVQIGQQIQLSYLPEKLPDAAGWEIAAHFEPAAEVAGDFYDSFTMSNNHISLIMGDVCDRGITAAMFMVLVRSLLRAFTQQHYQLNEGVKVGSNPDQNAGASLVDRLALKNAIELTNNYILNNHASMNMFATVFFGILDPISGILIYTNAGHEPPLIFNQSGVISRLNPTGSAVGMVPNVDYEIHQTQLDPGDTLLIYTDGVIDAKDSAGQSFGRDGLVELIEKSELSATALLNSIETNLRTYIAEEAQSDDITTLAVHRSE